MKKLSILSAVILSTLGASAFAAKARPGKAHSVGTGIVYPTLNHSLFVNPAALVDSPNISLQGAYLVDPENIHASITHGAGVFGLGAGYRQSGNSSIEEFGVGIKANILNFGISAQSSEFENFSFDAGVSFDLGSMRVGSVLRGIDGGISRYDIGFGFLINEATVEFDAKYDGNDAWLFDAALSLGTKLSVGVGYTFAYFNSEFIEGDLHAGVSAEIGKAVSLEAFYRPSPQEWATGDWVVGAKAVF